MQCESLDYDASTRELVDKIVSRGGIENRHGVLAHVSPGQYVKELEKPRARAALWEEHAPALAVAAARQALEQWPHGGSSDITHVVVHSCTGFRAPGLDFELITALGLRSTTRKVGVNYMGCFGFFTASYVAKQIVEADSSGRAVVLVVCAETCSVHFSRDPSPALLLGNALFADGAAAAIVTHAGFRGVGCRSLPPAPAPGTVIDPHTHTPIYRMADLVDPSDGQPYEWAVGEQSSDIVPDSAGYMTWAQGRESGQYDMFLDKNIPHALASMLMGPRALALLGRVGIVNPWTGTAWAIHPGGKAILKGFASALSSLSIPAHGLDVSASVLASYGNMSSPTIAYVLQRVCTGCAHKEAHQVFMAGFGPGLTVETGRLYKYKAGVSSRSDSATCSGEALHVGAAHDQPHDGRTEGTGLGQEGSSTAKRRSRARSSSHL